MYKAFYGFVERPFQLVPNPAFLYLSQSHEEALAHLAYAVSQGDGFVAITGEVGTGKTTICRVFLDNLDATTEAAYIINPKVDPLGLLKSINDEFGLDATANHPKTLIDTLNRFLLERNGRRKKVLLLIDEAHNLTRDVLEQVPLLSNLETNTSKLLQIILVGQPELIQMLCSRALRQLGQRITLAYELQPLSFNDTKAYIEHRIHVAAPHPRVPFNGTSLRMIYRFSGGIPRRINIACDRALLTGFVLNTSSIGAKETRAALTELSGDGRRILPTHGLVRRLFWPATLIILGTILWITLTDHFQGVKLLPGGVATLKGRATTSNASTALIPESNSTPRMAPPVREPTPEPVSGVSEAVTAQRPLLAKFVEGLAYRSSRRTAILGAMGKWNPAAAIQQQFDEMDDDGAFFQLAGRLNGLSIEHTRTSIAQLAKLNMPVVLTLLKNNDSRPVFAFVSHMDSNGLTLMGGTDSAGFRVAAEALDGWWDGETYIPWKNFYAFQGVIPFNASKDTVLTLKTLLKGLGYGDIEMTPFYDEPTRNAVRLIQQRYAIPADGVVGRLTQIAMYNEVPALPIPRLNSN